MKRVDIIARAGRNLRQAKVRTLLTALAISVGAFTITLALAAGTGGKAYTNSLLANNGDAKSLTVFAQAENANKSEGPKKYGETDTTTQGLLGKKDIQRIQQIAGVKSVTPMYNISATYVTGPNGEKYDASVSIKVDETGVELAAGSLDHNQPKAGTVIMSEDYVKALGYKTAAAAIGKPITLRIDKQSMTGEPDGGKDVTYTIAAVNKKSSTMLSYQSGIYINASDGQAIYDYQTPAGAADQYYGVTVRVADNADAQTVQKAIEAKNYQVFSMQDVQKVLFTFVNIVMGGAAGFGALAILASIFGIINTQYISVLERTQQIGLMKALGARRKDIGRLFRYEAAWVGFLGGLIGTVAAVAVGLLNPWIADKLDLEKGTNLLIFEPLTSVILIVALMIIAVLAGWFPSRKAAKLDPIEALRVE